MTTSPVTILADHVHGRPLVPPPPLLYVLFILCTGFFVLCQAHCLTLCVQKVIVLSTGCARGWAEDLPGEHSRIWSDILVFVCVCQCCSSGNLISLSLL
jgi:hypothetical protein